MGAIRDGLLSRPKRAGLNGRQTMNALAYLLGARALDVARNSESTREPVPESPLGPLATTEETAAAWHRWSLEGNAARGAATARRQLRSPAPSTPRRSPLLSGPTGSPA
jgi:hypothetical protein